MPGKCKKKPLFKIMKKINPLQQQYEKAKKRRRRSKNYQME